MTQALNNLSERERQILDLLANGWTDKQIARELEISDATVKVHNKRIRRKTGLTNRTAMATAMLRGQLASARLDALEEAAKICAVHAANSWEISKIEGQNISYASGRNFGSRHCEHTIRALMSRPETETKPAAQEMSSYGKIDMGYEA